MTPSAFRVDASLLTPEQENMSEDALRAQVMKMLRSPAFSRSPRLSRFLRFSVEQTLLHRQDNLKEYSIGLEVFERPESFDPRMDSIVRVVARRLRTVVEAYYADEGRTDPILICFRSGSYVPTFRLRSEETDRKASAEPLPLKTRFSSWDATQIPMKTTERALPVKWPQPISSPQNSACR